MMLTVATVAAWGQPIYLVGAKVLDPTGDRFLDGRIVIVEDGKITDIPEASTVRLSPGGQRVDLSGKWLIPGLIDLHSHLVLYPYDRRSWNDQVMKESIELRTIRGVRHARETLLAGWTTLRDLGTEGAGYADVALRDAIRSGIIEGPRVVTVTRALVATGCYGPSGFRPRQDIDKGAQVADGPLGCRIAVRQQIAAGADWIKVYADYRRKPGDPSTPTFSLDELLAICDEARSAKVKVAAHAVTAQAIKRAVLAGVHTIEHGYEADDDALKMMKLRGVTLCPTLAANEAIVRYRGGGRADHPRILKAKATFKRALEAGVDIACGSDVGVFAHGDNARELELMAAYGMGHKAALKAATIGAARVLADHSLGKIAPGAFADLVALDADPHVDVAACRKISFVMKAGKTIRGAP